MVKITLNQNLVPCVRDRYTKNHPDRDLTQNLVLARPVIQAACRIFAFRKGAARFSGYVAVGEKTPFRIHLWDGDDLLRTAVFPDLGYSGTLHCEIPNDSFGRVVGQDLLGDLLLGNVAPAGLGFGIRD